MLFLNQIEFLLFFIVNIIEYDKIDINKLNFLRIKNYTHQILIK